jgi:hypothetical protein
MKHVTGDIWEITIFPRMYYRLPANETIKVIGIVITNEDGSEEVSRN